MTVTELRVVALYGPIGGAAVAGLIRGRRRNLFAGCLLSLLWVLAGLAGLQCMNVRWGWWTFHNAGPAMNGMPLELYMGWVVLWGLVPALTFRSLDWPEVLAMMGALDLWLMLFCGPLVWLGRNWLMGELIGLVLVLAPAYCLARWTMEGSHLSFRAVGQVVLSGLLFLFFLPEVVFALRPSLGWQPLLGMRSVWRQMALQVLAMLALPGVSAAQEFAERGGGTPIPYDPPVRLVTSGVYRYCANPMQTSCAVVLAVWAMLLRSPWFGAAALVSVVYSAGLARWDEQRDLESRFGARWRSYRQGVGAWRFRWRPCPVGEPARLYIAASCGPCSELRRWIEARRPIGLTLLDAESVPSLMRVRYEPADGGPVEEGVRAFARALEHVHLGYAYCGFSLRLPGVVQMFQLLMDVSGFEPRVLSSELCYREEQGVK